MPTASTITALLALILACGIALGLARIRTRVHFWGSWVSWVPSLVMLFAFLLDVSGRRLLTFGTAALAVVFFGLALLGVRTLAHRPGALSFGGLYGVITIVGLLYTFGSLLQVRLDYQRNPTGGSLGGIDGDTVREFLVSQGTPLIVLALVVAGVWAQSRLPALRALVPQRLGSSIAVYPKATQAIAITLVVGAFFLPLLAPSTNGAHLTFLGIQMSEWARPFWILATAYLLARHRHYLNWRMVIRRDPNALALAGGLVALVVSVAVAGWLRSDFGMVLPFVFATPAMILTLSHQDRDAWLSSMGHRDSSAASPLTSRAARQLGLAALALGSVGVLLLVNFTIPGLKGRQEAWQDPWQFAWTIECTSTRNVPDWLSPGAGYTDPVPAGYELCIELQRDAINSDNSQTARALTVIDGGGLWGRGLSDTEAGIVPVRNSDFILASVWSKFGGLATALSTLLVVALWYLLTRQISRSTWAGRAESRGDWAYIYAAGLGAMIAGQAVYVLLATTNVAWLTGVPFPFLARGGQAMGGIVFGIVSLVFLIQQTAMPSEPRLTRSVVDAAAPVSLTRRSGLAVLRSVGIWGAVLASVAALAVGIAIPFASWQTGTLDAGLDHPGVQTQLRARGPASLLSIGGEVAFTQDRISGSWFAPDGVEPPLELHDLFGVVRTDDGGTMGLLEGTLGDNLQNTIERTSQDRLWETPKPRRMLDITVDPTLQTVATQAVREPVASGHRLPAGVVVLNASSGAIRALSTAPDETNPLEGRASDAEVRAWYDPKLDNKAWGELLGDIIRRPGDADCDSADVLCGRYRLRAVADPVRDEEYLRTFVGGDAAFHLPNPAQNRAVGRRYNLGSTFKIVITAAYLEAGGSINDRIASPDYVIVGGRRTGSRCPSASNGTITVVDALRVSCNTAFIQLARDLGWDSIAPVAERLGFARVERADAQNDHSLWPATAHIPMTVDHQSIATSALGGDLVASTPFQMAAMMATIANGGTFRDPYLVSGVTGDKMIASHGVEGTVALSPRTVEQLRAALAEVTGEGGTLDNVQYDKSRVRFYGKTGTHILDEELASGKYTARYFWIAGAAEKVQGDGDPIAFAVVVEGRDRQLGHTQVRAVVAKMLASYAESER